MTDVISGLTSFLRTCRRRQVVPVRCEPNVRCPFNTVSNDPQTPILSMPTTCVQEEMKKHLVVLTKRLADISIDDHEEKASSRYSTNSSQTIRSVRYRECQRNHAASVGGYAVDGCREFLPIGEDGTSGALTCAACGCHRNFHRREVQTEVASDASSNGSTE
ncbi:hypothetical protein LguiA_017200 [Lonicera macranthoides]